MSATSSAGIIMPHDLSCVTSACASSKGKIFTQHQEFGLVPLPRLRIQSTMGVDGAALFECAIRDEICRESRAFMQQAETSRDGLSLAQHED